MPKNDISLSEKKEIIIDFLNKCNAYSDQMLEKYEAQLEEGKENELPALKQKCHDWQSYKEFNAYAVGELKGTELDGWF